MSWLVDQERTGFVTPTRDAAALATALCQLRDDRDLAIAFGQAGRQKFEASFTIEASAAAIQSLYTTLVEPDQQATRDHR